MVEPLGGSEGRALRGGKGAGFLAKCAKMAILLFRPKKYK